MGGGRPGERLARGLRLRLTALWLPEGERGLWGLLEGLAETALGLGAGACSCAMNRGKWPSCR